MYHLYKKFRERSLKRTRRPAERHGFLRFENGELLSETREAVTLRGASLFWSQWEPEFYTANVLGWLADDWCIDIIRLSMAVAESGYLSHPRRELSKVLTAIDAAIALGIYVLVDWHSHDPHTAAAQQFFEEIAQGYRNVPHVLYETWNEPRRGYSWEDEIVRHHQAVIKAIRSYSPFAPVVVGTPDYCSAVDIASECPLSCENVGYAIHFYASTHREGLRRRIDHALARGIPIVATEWGMGDATGDGVLDQAEAQRWLSYLNAKRISHLNWSICDKDEACAALRPGSPSTPPWRSAHLTESGKFVRRYLREVGR